MKTFSWIIGILLYTAPRVVFASFDSFSLIRTFNRSYTQEKEGPKKKIIHTPGYQHIESKRDKQKIIRLSIRLISVGNFFINPKNILITV